MVPVDPGGKGVLVCVCDFGWAWIFSAFNLYGKRVTSSKSPKKLWMDWVYRNGTVTGNGNGNLMGRKGDDDHLNTLYIQEAYFVDAISLKVCVIADAGIFSRIISSI